MIYIFSRIWVTWSIASYVCFCLFIYMINVLDRSQEYFTYTMANFIQGFD